MKKLSLIVLLLVHHVLTGAIEWPDSEKGFVWEVIQNSGRVEEYATNYAQQVGPLTLEFGCHKTVGEKQKVSIRLRKNVGKYKAYLFSADGETDGHTLTLSTIEGTSQARWEPVGSGGTLILNDARGNKLKVAIAADGSMEIREGTGRDRIEIKTLQKVSFVGATQFDNLFLETSRAQCLGELRAQILEIQCAPVAKMPCIVENTGTLHIKQLKLASVRFINKGLWSNPEDRVEITAQVGLCGVENTQEGQIIAQGMRSSGYGYLKNQGSITIAEDSSVEGYGWDNAGTIKVANLLSWSVNLPTNQGKIEAGQILIKEKATLNNNGIVRCETLVG